jgi:hypothetical protein
VYLLQYGYAVIDLEKLDPINVDDLCLSQYLAYILQVYTKFAIFCLGVLVLPLPKNHQLIPPLNCSLFHKGTGQFVVDLQDSS